MSRYLNEGAVRSAVKRIPHITIQTRQAILEALRKVPTADVKEVKHGQWIEDKKDSSSRCSFVAGTQIMIMTMLQTMD